MKALSIRSDYAMEIMQGLKTIEYRSWSTHYRGPLLICGTAKKVPGGAPGYATTVAILTGIVKYQERDFGWQLAPYQPGGSYWIEPIQVKGHLGLFNVPDDRINPAPVTGPNDPQASQWFNQYIKPLVL